jgi:hypothetical protein
MVLDTLLLGQVPHLDGVRYITLGQIQYFTCTLLLGQVFKLGNVGYTDVEVYTSP